MTTRALPQLQLGPGLRLVAAGLIALAVHSVFGQTGATPATTSSWSVDAPYVPTMMFDVASVRQNNDVDLMAGIMMSGGFVPHTTVLRLTNWSIENLISYAYGVDRSQLANTPKWPPPTVFVIDAKGDNEANTKIAALTVEQQRLEQQHMLQALLEERFKLKTHWETKEGNVYNLVVTKRGSKLGPKNSTLLPANIAKISGDNPIPTLLQKNDGQGYDFIGHKCSMAELAGMLTGQFGRPVVDKTELRGRYDFVLKYKGRWDRDRSADDLDPLPPMDRALQEELGLKVEAVKGPVKVLVIDQIEKPSEN